MTVKKKPTKKVSSTSTPDKKPAVVKRSNKKKRTPVRKLTAKQALFVKHYLANGRNGTQAAISAGYSKKSAKIIANQLLNKTLLKQAIDKATEKVTKKLDYDAEQWLKDQLKIKEICMGEAEAPRVTFIEGMPVPFNAKVFESTGANRSQELLGKNLKILSDKIDINQKTKVSFNFDLTGRGNTEEDSA